LLIELGNLKIKADQIF